jgi:hypothetical protein
MTARRLATILGVVSYSRLPSADEADERPAARRRPHVWYWGKSGSSSRAVKVMRLTHTRYAASRSLDYLVGAPENRRPGDTFAHWRSCPASVRATISISKYILMVRDYAAACARCWNPANSWAISPAGTGLL